MKTQAAIEEDASEARILLLGDPGLRQASSAVTDYSDPVTFIVT